MSRQLADLQAVLTQLTAEHQKLLDLMEAQHLAMKKFDLNAMAELVTKQEATRLRINSLEQKRRAQVRLLMTSLKLTEEPRLKKLAELFPNQAEPLLKARADLREVAKKITVRSQGSHKLASAVLGHLNTVMRLLAAVVERAGLYTKQGVPRVATRIGVMDAVG
jgi:hypothetical protein